MSGTVLESEASLILKQGRTEGIRQGRAEGVRQEREKMIRNTIEKCRDSLGYDRTNTIEFLMLLYDLNETAATQYTAEYWGNEE